MQLPDRLLPLSSNLPWEHWDYRHLLLLPALWGHWGSELSATCLSHQCSTSDPSPQLPPPSVCCLSVCSVLLYSPSLELKILLPRFFKYWEYSLTSQPVWVNDLNCPSINNTNVGMRFDAVTTGLLGHTLLLRTLKWVSRPSDNEFSRVTVLQFNLPNWNSLSDLWLSHFLYLFCPFTSSVHPCSLPRFSWFQNEHE